jgi:RNA polymerase sigma-70 factor (ECF subfamily)
MQPGNGDNACLRRNRANESIHQFAFRYGRAADVERHRRELLIHCYRMLGSLPDAEDAVQETSLRAWRYRDSLKEDQPLRPGLYRVATNACLDAMARDARRAVLAARATVDEGWAGEPDDVVWLGPIPDSVLEPPTPPARTPETITLMRETIEIAFLTVIQLLTPKQRATLILCDVLDWSAKDAADLLDISVSAPHKPAWPASVAERDLLKKYIEASEAADFRGRRSRSLARARCNALFMAVRCCVYECRRNFNLYRRN